MMKMSKKDKMPMKKMPKGMGKAKGKMVPDAKPHPCAGCKPMC
jgi:hypothetical protein